MVSPKISHDGAVHHLDHVGDGKDRVDSGIAGHGDGNTEQLEQKRTRRKTKERDVKSRARDPIDDDDDDNDDNDDDDDDVKNDENNNDGDSSTKDFVKKRTRRETNPSKKKNKRARAKPSHMNTSAADATHPITESILREFAERYDVKNAGANVDSLSAFLRLARSRGHLTWTIVFHDQSCTSPFLPSTEKYCTEKGPPCTHWNCVCDSQIRACQAAAPLVGAMFVFPMDEESRDLDCFLLPLGPTLDPDEGPKDLDPGYERMAQWPFLPILCDTTLRQRWEAFRSILMDKHLVCVTFNAQLGLMPYHYHCTHDIETTTGTDSRSDEQSPNLLVPRIFDIRLASWMLAPQSTEKDHEIDKKYQGFPHLWPDLESPPSDASDQTRGLIEANEKLRFLYALYPIVNGILDSNGLKSSFEDIESPVQSILSSMECNGIGFRAERLVKIQGIIESRIGALHAEARTIAHDDTFLMSSPQQVSQLLFEKMGIEPPAIRSRSKAAAGSKHVSTSEEALRAVQSRAVAMTGTGLPVVDIILEFRTLSKMLNTYIRPYPRLARPSGNGHVLGKRHKGRKSRTKGGPPTVLKMHPMWMQTAVRTGRLSCRKPNMQQIPTKSVYDVSLRHAFTSSCEETCLFAFDYSQNEVRILAHMSGDSALISLFRQPGNTDIYKQMSSVTTGKPIEHITDKERAVSKQVTLAIMYVSSVPLPYLYVHRTILYPL